MPTSLPLKQEGFGIFQAGSHHRPTLSPAACPPVRVTGRPDRRGEGDYGGGETSGDKWLIYAAMAQSFSGFRLLMAALDPAIQLENYHFSQFVSYRSH